MESRAMTWLNNKQIVVPVDFSEESYSAVDKALELVEEASQVHLVHVLTDLEPMAPGLIWGTVDDESRARHAAQALRDRLSRRMYN